MTSHVVPLLGVLFVILGSGCAYKYTGPITGKAYTTYALINLYGGGPEYDREVRLAAYLKAHPDTSSDVKQMTLEGKVQLGMTAEQVVISWGEPRAVNKTMSGWGTSEQWIYGDPIYNAHYLYFDDGRLTSIQTSH